MESEQNLRQHKEDMLLAGMTSLYAAEGIIKLYGMIGRGSFATVFHCRDEKRGEVAVKFFDLQFSFQIECQELMKLRHPCLVHMYSTIAQPECRGLVLELCGRTVDDLLHTHWGRTMKVAADPIHRLNMGLDVARALKYLHRKSICHGSVTPKHVFVDRKLTAGSQEIGHVKLGGLTNMRKNGSMVKPTGGGSLIYLAPEELDESLSQAQSGFSRDAYAYGVLLYELLTRTRPYSEHGLGSNPQLHVLVKAGLRPDVREVPTDSTIGVEMGHRIQRRLIASMEKSWCGDPNARPAISNVLAELKDIMKDWTCMRFCLVVALASACKSSK